MNPNIRPIVQRLPDEHLLRIGEAITSWAVLEYELKALAYLMLGVGFKRGRIAVRSPRASEILDMITDLMIIDGMAWNIPAMKRLGEHLDELERRRNTLAHNVWVKGADDRYYVQSLTGAWPSKKGEPRRNRRLEPAGIPVETHNLTDLVLSTRKVTESVMRLRQEIAAQLAALPETHREQADPTPHLRRRESTMPPPKTSPELSTQEHPSMSPKPTPTPQPLKPKPDEDEVLRRMLSSPPSPHKPKQEPAKKKAPKRGAP